MFPSDCIFIHTLYKSNLGVMSVCIPENSKIAYPGVTMQILNQITDIMSKRRCISEKNPKKPEFFRLL